MGAVPADRFGWPDSNDHQHLIEADPPTMTDSSAAPCPHLITTKKEFSEGLQYLRERSAFSYRKAGAEIDRPATTISGWCNGHHLPYQRDNDVVRDLLTLLGAEPVEAWMEALARVRDNERRRKRRLTVRPGRATSPVTPSQPTRSNRSWSRWFRWLSPTQSTEQPRRT